MPVNAPGEININCWVEARSWVVSIGSGEGFTAREAAQVIASWSGVRASNSRCLLVGQAFDASPGSTFKIERLVTSISVMK